MRFDKFSFGSIRIDGSTYEHDVIIDRGEIRKRKKKPSKKFREQFGHMPLSMKRKSPGNVTNSSSAVVHMVDCPSCREYSAKPSVTKSNWLSCPLSTQSRC